MAAVQGPGRFGSSVYWLLGLLLSLAGTVTAWRQVLLQSSAVQQLSTCEPNLADLFSSTPWVCVVQRMFNGTADCTNISWTLFDLSIPEWSLLFFLAMTIRDGLPVAAPCLDRLSATAQRRVVAPGAGGRLNTCMNFISCVP